MKLDTLSPLAQRILSSLEITDVSQIMDYDPMYFIGTELESHCNLSKLGSLDFTSEVGYPKSRHYQLFELIQVRPEYLRYISPDSFFKQVTDSFLSPNVATRVQMSNLIPQVYPVACRIDPEYIVPLLECNEPSFSELWISNTTKQVIDDVLDKIICEKHMTTWIDLNMHRFGIINQIWMHKNPDVITQPKFDDTHYDLPNPSDYIVPGLLRLLSHTPYVIQRFVLSPQLFTIVKTSDLVRPVKEHLLKILKERLLEEAQTGNVQTLFYFDDFNVQHLTKVDWAKVSHVSFLQIMDHFQDEHLRKYIFTKYGESNDIRPSVWISAQIYIKRIPFSEQVKFFNMELFSLPELLRFIGSNNTPDVWVDHILAHPDWTTKVLKDESRGFDPHLLSAVKVSPKFLPAYLLLANVNRLLPNTVIELITMNRSVLNIMTIHNYLRNMGDSYKSRIVRMFPETLNIVQ